jgi:hypothetical protein
MKGTHRPGYRPPRTGEKRKTRQPIRIDALPEEVRAEIQKRRAAGETWDEIAEATKLPPTTLKRWYDLRVDQVNAEVAAQAARARELAAAFAGRSFEKLPEAVQSALSSAIFSLAERQDEASRAMFIKSMNDMAWLLARNRQLDQEERRLEIESKKLDLVREKLRGVKDEVAKKKLSPEELARKLDEIYDITRPA